MRLPTHYQSIQAHVGLRFQKINATKELSDMLICFWKVWNQKSSPYHFLIIPDGTVDLMIDLPFDSKLKVVVSQKEPITILMPPPSCVFGIRFYPSAFTSVFKVPVNEFSENFKSFDEVVPGKTVSLLAEQLIDAKDINSKKEVFEKFVISFLARNELVFDYLLLNTLHLIYENKGIVAISEGPYQGSKQKSQTD